MRVHQLLTSLAPGDAVSNHALFVQQQLRDSGFESEIFAEYISDSMRMRGHNLERFLREDTPDAILLAHYSIASSSMVALPEYKSKKILVYHNVTPYEYLVDIYPLMAFHCLRGRTDLPRIAPSIKYGIAFSRYSERELNGAGVDRTAVLPLIVDMSRLDLPPDPLVSRALSNARERRILVVGRVVPNKKVEEAIKIVSMLPRSRLIVAGSYVGCEKYYFALLEMATRLGVQCEFTGHISQEELNAIYRSTNLMLVVSDHEGYCVPLMEAYHFGIPVIAFAAGAIPETAGEGAILFSRRDSANVALMAGRVLEDAALRKRLSEAGSKVLQRYHEFPFQERLVAIVREVAAKPV